MTANCFDRPDSSLLSKPTDKIYFHTPPIDSTTLEPIRTTASQRGSTWPVSISKIFTCILFFKICFFQGGIQFFARSLRQIEPEIIDCFILNIILEVNQSLVNQTINGFNMQENATFTVNLELKCTINSYGSDCSIYCEPSNNTQGHYRCLENGSKECLEGYRNESTDCIECVPAEGCRESTFPFYSFLSFPFPIHPYNAGLSEGN